MASPLNLPEGSVRGIIAIIALIGLIIGIILKLEHVEVLSGLVGTIVGYFFGIHKPLKGDS